MDGSRWGDLARLAAGLVPLGRLTSALRHDRDASEALHRRAIEARIASEQTVADATLAAAHAIATSRRSERVLASYRRAEQVQREAHH